MPGKRDECVMLMAVNLSHWRTPEFLTLSLTNHTFKDSLNLTTSTDRSDWTASSILSLSRAISQRKRKDSTDSFLPQSITMYSIFSKSAFCYSPPVLSLPSIHYCGSFPLCDLMPHLYHGPPCKHLLGRPWCLRCLWCPHRG